MKLNQSEFETKMMNEVAERSLPGEDRYQYKMKISEALASYQFLGLRDGDICTEKIYLEGIITACLNYQQVVKCYSNTVEQILKAARARLYKFAPPKPIYKFTRREQEAFGGAEGLLATTSLPGMGIHQGDYSLKTGHSPLFTRIRRLERKGELDVIIILNFYFDSKLKGGNLPAVNTFINSRERGLITAHYPQGDKDKGTTLEAEIGYYFKTQLTAEDKEESILEISDLWIHAKRNQNLGLGSLLIYEVLSTAELNYQQNIKYNHGKILNIKEVFLTSVSESIGFYKKLGFNAPYGNYLGGNIDTIISNAKQSCIKKGWIL